MSEVLYDFVFSGPGLYLLMVVVGIAGHAVSKAVIERREIEKLQAVRDTARAQLDASRAAVRYVAKCSACRFKQLVKTPDKIGREIAIEVDHAICCSGSITLLPAVALPEEPEHPRVESKEPTAEDTRRSLEAAVSAKLLPASVLKESFVQELTNFAAKTVQASPETRVALAAMTAKWPVEGMTLVMPNGMTIEEMQDRMGKDPSWVLRNPYILRQPPPLPKPQLDLFPKVRKD